MAVCEWGSRPDATGPLDLDAGSSSVGAARKCRNSTGIALRLPHEPAALSGISSVLPQKYQSPTLIVWGKNDTVFPAEGALPYKRDLPNAEIHLIDTGHFALERELDDEGLMYARHASINDLPITEVDRKFRWPLGKRTDGHPGLSDLGL